jgi:uncharacterized protein YqeY
MNLYERLQHDMKEAMKARDSERVDVLRMAMSAIKAAHSNQVKQAYDAAGGDANPVASEAAAQAVVLSEIQMQDSVAKEVKRRHESAGMFTKGNRPELAEKELREVRVLESYLPKMMEADELRPLIVGIIQSVGAQGASDMNKVMPVVMQQFKGKADGRLLNQLVRELLS